MNGKGNKISQPKSREQSEQNAIKNMRSLFIIKNKSKTIKVKVIEIKTYY